jgi:DNA-binding GntR family transcriptional regulator
MPLQLEPLRNRALRDSIAQVIRSAIATGQLRPGDSVPEALIAEQLGVSRSPVREAFRKLEAQGLLVSFPHRGTYVTQFTEKDAQEIYQLRVGLEGLAMRWAVEGGYAEELRQRLSDIIDRMRIHVGTDNFLEMAELDSEFHSTIIEASGNARLVQVWRGMDPFVWMLVGLIRYDEPGVPVRLIPEHEAVVAALAKNDARLAEDAIHAHILQRRDVALDALREDMDRDGAMAPMVS